MEDAPFPGAAGIGVLAGASAPLSRDLQACRVYRQIAVIHRLFPAGIEKLP